MEKQKNFHYKRGWAVSPDHGRLVGYGGVVLTQCIGLERWTATTHEFQAIRQLVASADPARSIWLIVRGISRGLRIWGSG